MTFKNWVSPQSVRSYGIKRPFTAIRPMIPFHLTTLTTYTTSYDAICKYMHTYTFCKLVTSIIVVALHQQDHNLLVYFLLLFHLWIVSGKQKSAKAQKLFYCKLYHAKEEQNYLNTIFSDSNTFILACRFRSSLYKPNIKMGIKI